MRTITLLIFLFTGGCCFPYDPSHDTPHPDESRAVDITLNEWHERSGLATPSNAFPIIFWQHRECLYVELNSDDHSDRYEEKCLQGFLRRGDCGRIEIILIYNQDISETSLAHEALHWVLWINHGDGDADHENDLWGEVDNVNRVIRDRL